MSLIIIESVDHVMAQKNSQIMELNVHLLHIVPILAFIIGGHRSESSAHSLFYSFQRTQFLLCQYMNCVFP